MRRRLLAWILASLASTGAILACSDAYTGKDPIYVEDDPADTGTKSRPKADTGTPDPDPPPPVPIDSGAGGRVLAHTGKQLFRLEPETRRLTLLGTFACLEPNDDVIDIAVDRTGAVYATSFKGFLSVDPLAASCSYIAKGQDYPNSLSFVPVGTVDATKEALVGYAFDPVRPTRYVRIDTVTGAMTTLGNLNPANATTEYVSSGDLVGLIHDANRAYLTVRFKSALPDGGALPDRLAEIDPATGTLKRILGDTKQRNLFGFGYWAGKGYGFADDGTVAEIDMATGAGTPLTLVGVTTKQKWYGAGVSTQAPGP